MYNITKDIINPVLAKATNQFTCCSAVNDNYVKSFLVIENEIARYGSYDFDYLLTWVNAYSNNFSKTVYHYVKRSLYMLDDFIRHETFTQKSYGNLSRNSSLFYLSSVNYKLLETYIEQLSFSNATKTNKTRHVSIFLNYLQSIDTYLPNINFDILFTYYCIEKSRLPLYLLTRQCNEVCFFLLFCFENHFVSNYSHTYFLDDNIIKYFPSIINALSKKTELFDVIIDHCLYIDTNDITALNAFQEYHILNKYSNSTISKYLHSIKCYFVFLNYSGYYHSYTLLNLWCLHIIRTKIYDDLSHKTAVLKLVEFISNNFTIVNRTWVRRGNQLDFFPAWSKYHFDRYIKYRNQLGYTKSTINMDINAIFRFVTFMDNTGIHSYDDITLGAIHVFHKQDKHSTYQGKNAYTTRIRNFLIFLNDDNVIPYHFILALPTSAGDTKKVITTLDDDTVALIYASSEQFQTSIELRDYAIVLVGIQTGLRGIDIINLKFENISLTNKVLTIMQSKTNKTITLPLPIQSANAIYRYVKYGRPHTNSSHIFIRSRAPYIGIRMHGIISAIPHVLSRLQITYDSMGFHITRRTFATTILKRGTQIDIISYSLGHSTNATVHKYLGINDQEMKKCAISMQRIPYRGALYE